MIFHSNNKPGSDTWYRDAGDPSELISITRFVSDDVFATRAGGYGATFQLAGIDSECLEVEAACTASEDVLRGLRLIPKDLVLYQVAIKRKTAFVPELAHVGSKNPVIAETQRSRQNHLQSGFGGLSLYFTLYAPPPRRQLRPAERDRATEEQLRLLQETARALQINLQRFSLRRLKRQAICDLYGYIANLHSGYSPQATVEPIAAELPVESLTWCDDGLKIGTRHARLFSLSRVPAETHPNLLGSLLQMDADLILMLETRRCQQAETESDLSAQEKFVNFFRESLLTMVAYFGNQAAINAKPKSAASHAADHSIGVGGLAGVQIDLQAGLTYTQTSLIGVLHSADRDEVTDQMARAHMVAGAAKAILLQEGLGALSAYCSLFPGGMIAGRTTNVRRRWLREDHVSDLSLVYIPERGNLFSPTLEQEALAIFETRDGTEFAYDPYNSSGVRGCFVIGETGSGKSFLLNFVIDHETKYGGFVYVFDVGGSFEHTILKHGGKVIRFGLAGPRLNPLSLPDEPQSHRFVQRLVRMLLLKGGARLTPQQETEVNERVTRMFSLAPSVRRLRHLVLPPAVQPYLAKWITDGVYGNIFDNISDELELSRLAVFDFEALGEGNEQQDLMEPLLSWIRWRINSFTQDSANLGLPKLEIYDECWRHLRDEQMAAMIVASAKTGRKHLGGIMLATQSAEDLGAHAQLIRTNCPDAIFLGNSVNREYCADLFGLTAKHLELISSLQRGEFLLLRREYGKVCRLSVDDASRWLYSTHPQDRLRRTEAIEKYGRERAFQQLAISANAK